VPAFAAARLDQLMAHMADSVASVEVEPFLQDSVREAWRTFKADAVLYIAGTLLLCVVSIVTLTVLAGPLAVGLIGIIRRRRRGEAAQISDVFDGLSQFASSFVAFLLIAIATSVGLLLAVVPGLLVLLATCFAFHEIAYRERHAGDALRASYAIAKNHVLHVLLLLIGVAALNALGNAVVFGGFLTAPFAAVWMTVAYEMLTDQTPGRSVAVVQPPTA
jgi:uncharacterized membrane protein